MHLLNFNLTGIELIIIIVTHISIAPSEALELEVKSSISVILFLAVLSITNKLKHFSFLLKLKL